MGTPSSAISAVVSVESVELEESVSEEVSSVVEESPVSVESEESVSVEVSSLVEESSSVIDSLFALVSVFVAHKHGLSPHE